MTSIRKLKKRIRRENWLTDDEILNKEQIRRYIRGETRLNCCTQLRCHQVRRAAIMRAKKHRLHPVELAEKNASFDLIGYIQKKFKAAKFKESLINNELWQKQ